MKDTVVDSATREKHDARKSALGSLLNAASGKREIVRCLSLVVPVKSDHYNALTLKTQTRPQLEALAKFMGIAETNNRVFSNREKLAVAVMRRFNQLTPCLCAECNVKYKLSLDGVPSIECHSCGRGAHSCDRVSASLQQQREVSSSLAHMVWLCYDCYHSSGTTEVPGTATPASISARSRNNSTSSQSEKAPVTELLKEAAEGLSEFVVTEEVAASEDSEKSESEKKEKEEEDTEKEEDDPEEIPDTRPVCRAFLEWGCKHGTRGEKLIMGRPCKDRHLTVCKPFLKFGTSQKGCTDTNCALFHPKLCKFVQTETCCFNSKCKLFHPFRFNKLRKAAVKKRATKLAVSKERSQPSSQACPTTTPLPEKTDEIGKSASYQDFLKFEEVLTRMIVRMDSMEKSLSRLQVQGLPGPPLKSTWIPQSQIPDFSFMNQSAWC